MRDVAKLPRGLLDKKDVVRLLRATVKSAESQSDFAQRMGVERSHLNSVLNGKRPLSPSIIKALNLRIVYVPK
jgi:transcriptional regulator with XRE-family HTH domain